MTPPSSTFGNNYTLTVTLTDNFSSSIYLMTISVGTSASLPLYFASILEKKNN
jgi:hypothetical protein